MTDCLSSVKFWDPVGMTQRLGVAQKLGSGIIQRHLYSHVWQVVWAIG